jgi:peptidoglycan/LPS O-acetylase OafA/YrhL
MENPESRRNFTLDLYKAIAAIGVVLVHFQFPGVMGRILCSVGVCGVAFFFIISGYFAYDPDDAAACSKLMKRFRRNLLITLAAVAVYLVFTVAEQLILGTFTEWLGHFRDPWLIPRMVILGDFEFIHGDPLWFMPALLYSYLILFVLHRLKISKYSYIVLPLLLLLRIGMETYTNSFGADWHMSGNFLVGGIPLMLLGHYMAYRKESFTKIPLHLTVPFCVMSAVLMFVTVNVRVFALDVSQIFKVWCAAEVFILCITVPGRKAVPVLGTVGDRYSLYIYLSHYLIGVLLKDILTASSAPVWIRDWILPAAVIILSVLVSALLYRLFGNRKSRKA